MQKKKQKLVKNLCFDHFFLLLINQNIFLGLFLLLSGKDSACHAGD